MNIKLDAFIQAANNSSGNAVIKSPGNDPQSLRTGGFWSRLFSRMGLRTEKNQRVMREFCAAIGEQMGVNAGDLAGNLLRESMEAGKPLTAYAVKEVVREVESSLSATRKDIVEYNNKIILSTYFNTRLPEEGFARHVRDALPVGVTLEDSDLTLLRRQIKMDVEKEGEFDHAITRDWLKDRMQLKIPSILKGVTGEYLAELERLADSGGIPPHVTGEELQRLRPCIIALGITSIAELKASLQAMSYVAGAIPRLDSASCALGFLDFLREFNQVLDESVTANLESVKDAGALLCFAINGAVLLGKVPEEEAKRIGREKIAEGPGREIFEKLDAVRQATSGDGFRTNVLAGLYETIINAYGWDGLMPVAVEKDSGGDVRAPALSTSEKVYLHLAGLASDDWIRDLCSYIGLPEIRDGFAGATDLDIARLAGSGSGSGFSRNIRDGFLVSLASLPALKNAQPGDAPFIPQTVWRIIMKQEPPPGVTGDNLLERLGAAWVRKVADAVASCDADYEEHGLDPIIVLQNAIVFTGLDPARGLEILTAHSDVPREIGLGDLLFPREEKGPEPSREREEAAIAKMANEIPRRGIPAAVDLGGEIINLDAAALGTEEERLRYRDAAPGNPVAARIVESVNELCGGEEESMAQRTVLFTLLGANGAGLLSFMAPIAGLHFTEHSSCNMMVRRQDSGKVMLIVETPEEVGGEGRMRCGYEIDVDGGYRIVDLEVRGR